MSTLTRQLLEEVYPLDEAPTDTNFPRWMPTDGAYGPPIHTSMRRVELALALAKCGPGDVVLDLGCGDGRFCIAALTLFNAASATGVDCDADAIESATVASKQVLSNLPQIPIQAPSQIPSPRFLCSDIRDPSVVSIVTDPQVTVLIAFLTPEFSTDCRSLILDHYSRGARIVAVCFDLANLHLDLVPAMSPCGIDGLWVYQKRTSADVLLARMQEMYLNDEEIAPTDTNFPRWVEEDDLYAPFIPTSFVRVRRALEMAKCGAGDVVLDLGAGDGRFCAAAVGLFKARAAVGFESDDILVERAAGMWAHIAREHDEIDANAVQFIIKDFRDTQDSVVRKWLNEVTIVVVFLSPEFGKEFERKLVDLHERGVCIVALCFNLSEIPALTLRESGDDIWIYSRKELNKID